jgi:hypothetical protein
MVPVPERVDRAQFQRFPPANFLFCTVRFNSGTEMENLAVVALLNDMPEHNLCRGQVGTIVENLAPDVYEVEFSDDEGRTYASLALPAAELIRLHHEPVWKAA